MLWDFNNNQPIYIQLVESLKISIISGQYPKGGKLPSVRDLALEVGVNPNTMHKALVELEEIGLIITKRTNGKFVTEDDLLINKYKADLAFEKANNYLTTMKSLGFTKDEAIKYMKEEK